MERDRGWEARYGTQEISQFHGAELMAAQWEISREDTERFALESHRRALAAIANGWFEAEITPFAGVTADEGPRADTSLEKMASLQTLLPGGVLTAAAVEPDLRRVRRTAHRFGGRGRRYGFTPRARIHHMPCSAPTR